MNRKREKIEGKWSGVRVFGIGSGLGISIFCIYFVGFKVWGLKLSNLRFWILCVSGIACCLWHPRGQVLWFRTQELGVLC